MTWFVASVIIELRRNGQDSNERVVAYENLYLIKASSAEEGRDRAREVAIEACVDDPTLTVGGEPAKMLFSGVRKIVSISNPLDRDLDQDPPVHGTELTYSEYWLADRAALDGLITGQPIDVRYVE